MVPLFARVRLRKATSGPPRGRRRRDSFAAGNAGSEESFWLTRPRKRGIALVLVLAVIVLLSLLLIGMLGVVQNELKINVHYADAMDSRIMADSAVRVVQAQIREATLAGIDGSGRGTFAWASQPGALRVFQNAQDTGQIYKLYSSDVMVTGDPASLANDIPGDWESRPDEFVDLNEPVKRSQWIYPIANPAALDGSDRVVGFSSDRPDNPDGGMPWDDRLAMPARWIYVMEDGSMSTDPTAGSPVSRLAFWTDDESSKINVNTASATDTQSYADVPRANYQDERAIMAMRQPAQNEYNRYPGHPATVSLSMVFPDRNNQGNAWLQSLINATPRYQWGGSANGTLTIGAGRTPILNTKEDRLYATMDEFLYASGRTAQLNLTEQKLDQSRFFLTASSRSPDLNLFGQPRVTIWPLSADTGPNYRTPYDNLIAFCSTIGSNPYYFVRSRPLDQQYDWQNFPRNQGIFEYLQDATGRSIPGFGGNFRTKYDTTNGGVPGERDQILTEIFDYIRCSNLNDTFLNQPPGFVSYTTKATEFVRSSAKQLEFAGIGYVLPIETPYGRGAGRVPVVSEVGVWLIQTTGTSTEPAVQPGLIVETFSPMQGYMPWIAKNFSIEVENVGTGPRIRDGSGNEIPLFPNDTTPNWGTSPSQGLNQGQSMGGIDGWAWNMSAASNTFFRNPFLTKADQAIKIGTSGTVNILGGDIRVFLRCVPGANAQNQKAPLGSFRYQEYTIRIPDAAVPVPDAVAPSHTNDNGDGWPSRISASSDIRFLPQDVVRGLAIRDGDFRTVAYLESVPASFFEDGNQWNSMDQFVHGFRGGVNQAYLGTQNGSYVEVSGGYGPESPTTDLWSSGRPKIPAAIEDLRTLGWEGDFDNGVGELVDGPYLNKSDEGGIGSPGSTPYFNWQWNLASGLFSPLRQMPSAVVFGSLPTSIKRAESGSPRPWRTLNFCPNPLAGDAHYGLSDPPDHLLLDLFTMPVVEPYAISDPFATAGRLNVNYEIAPFSYIKRTTAMHAALASQKVVAIQNDYASDYKALGGSGANVAKPIRFSVNIPETLTQFAERFEDGDVFRSASEICGVFLVPDAPGVTADTVKQWWDGFKLTGNNSRERPYATLYPLLTTKSNTYCTHVRAQAIKRLPNGQIIVTSEYRGSVLFERFLDPNDPAFAGAVDPDDQSLEPYYRFRTLVAKQFNP